MAAPFISGIPGIVSFCRRERPQWPATLSVLAGICFGLLMVGLCFPQIIWGSGGAHNAAPRASAKNDTTQLVTAIKQFYTDYGYYPCNETSGGDENDYFATGRAAQAKVVNILRAWTIDADAAKYNTRDTIYLDVPNAKNPSNPKSGIGPDGVWYDPWGNPYLIRIDSNNKGEVLNPYSANAGDATLKVGVIVWSLGPDGKGATSATGNGDKNAGANLDDVLSWQ